MRPMAVWMDHEQARIFHVDAATFDETTVHSAIHRMHSHPKDQDTRTHNHPDDEHRFFREGAGDLRGADEILLVGPSVTKLHFIRYAHKHDPDIERKIVGVETADHPTDRQLVAHVRQYFHNPLPRIGTK